MTRRDAEAMAVSLAKIFQTEASRLLPPIDRILPKPTEGEDLPTLSLEEYRDKVVSSPEWIEVLNLVHPMRSGRNTPAFHSTEADDDDILM